MAIPRITITYAARYVTRIFDSELPYQDSITQMGVEADSDFVILSHNLEFIGICPSCKDSLKSL